MNSLDTSLTSVNKQMKSETNGMSFCATISSSFIARTFSHVRNAGQGIPSLSKNKGVALLLWCVSKIRKQKRVHGNSAVLQIFYPGSLDFGFFFS